MTTSADDSIPFTWKKYLWASGQFLGVFYVATFCLGYLLLHRSGINVQWLFAAGVLYFLIIVLSGVRLVKKLTITSIMIAAPTIPLCMLILVVSLLPIFQMLDKWEHARPKLVPQQQLSS